MASYNKIKIIFHIVIFKLKYKTVKTAIKMNEIMQKIENRQQITLNDLKHINLKNLRTAIKFHNKYTLNDDKINAKMFSELVSKYIVKLNVKNPKNSTPVITLISQLIDRKTK